MQILAKEKKTSQVRQYNANFLRRNHDISQKMLLSGSLFGVINCLDITFFTPKQGGKKLINVVGAVVTVNALK